MQPTRTYLTILPPTKRQTLSHHRLRRSHLTTTSLQPSKSAGLLSHYPRGIGRSAKRVRRGTIRKETGFSPCLNHTASPTALRISVYNSRHKTKSIPAL